ncbi:MAG TPA: hypothetical protein VNF93_00410 [Buchnera sp. (in: enterobacteria)]|nr:hypothetical protein [Buchnera sp. (in: enterobacteria)]
MKVTFELSESSARYLRSYASLGRWCDSITRLTKEITKGKIISEDLEEDAIYVEESVVEMKPALMEFHLNIKDILEEMGVKPLWDQNQK